MYQLGALTLITPPDVGDPVLTSAVVKDHLRIDGTEFDSLISGWVGAATQAAQTELNRQLVSATYELALDAFPAWCIDLPRGPLSVASVKYIDQAGAEQTLAAENYVVDVRSTPGRVVLADGYSWPTTQRRPNAVVVRYVAGFGVAAAVPESIKQWMLLHCGTSKKIAESVVTGVSVSEMPSPFLGGLLDPWRILVA